MTPLPKKRIPLKLKEEILADLNLFFDSLESNFERELFFQAFLTPVEKEVLAKRLKVAILILKGSDYKEIEEKLNTSAVTISKIRQALFSSPELSRLIYMIFIYPEENAKKQEAIDRKLKIDNRRTGHPRVDRGLEMLGILPPKGKKREK